MSGDEDTTTSEQDISAIPLPQDRPARNQPVLTDYYITLQANQPVELVPEAEEFEQSTDEKKILEEQESSLEGRVRLITTREEDLAAREANLKQREQLITLREENVAAREAEIRQLAVAAAAFATKVAKHVPSTNSVPAPIDSALPAQGTDETASASASRKM